MHLTHDPVANAVYVYLAPTASWDHSDAIDDGRVIDYDAEGHPIGVEFLGVNNGVHLAGLPEQQAIGEALARELPGIPTHAA